jgi:hypothetical protein
VRCTECNTVVGVYDTEEVYHFFNVLASHWHPKDKWPKVKVDTGPWWFHGYSLIMIRKFINEKVEFLWTISTSCPIFTTNKYSQQVHMIQRVASHDWLLCYNLGIIMTYMEYSKW